MWCVYCWLLQCFMMHPVFEFIVNSEPPGFSWFNDYLILSMIIWIHFVTTRCVQSLMIKIPLMFFLLISSSMVYAMDFICEAESGNSSASIKPVVSLDPYETNQVDLSGNFRFSAQYLLSKEKLKTFVYHYAKDRYILIHAAEYRVEKITVANTNKGWEWIKFTQRKWSANFCSNADQFVVNQIYCHLWTILMKFLVIFYYCWFSIRKLIQKRRPSECFCRRCDAGWIARRNDKTREESIFCVWSNIRESGCRHWKSGVRDQRERWTGEKPFTFRAHPRVIPLLKKYFSALSLANNHSGDYGPLAFQICWICWIRMVCCILVVGKISD